MGDINQLFLMRKAANSICAGVREGEPPAIYILGKVKCTALTHVSFSTLCLVFSIRHSQLTVFFPFHLGGGCLLKSCQAGPLISSWSRY